jgi:hypothetical protein
MQFDNRELITIVQPIKRNKYTDQSRVKIVGITRY